PFDAVATEYFLPVRVLAAVTVTPGSGVFPARTVPVTSKEVGCAGAVVAVGADAALGSCVEDGLAGEASDAGEGDSGAFGCCDGVEPCGGGWSWARALLAKQNASNNTPTTESFPGGKNFNSAAPGVSANPTRCHSIRWQQ